MAEQTQIGWTDSTFNPWIGCQHVSPGCDDCYAETLMDKRYGKVKWGPHGERKRTSESYWKKPLAWNWQGPAFEREHGHRRRVFCASLADVFDNRVPAQWRMDLFSLIKATPNLDWLLLTKRPENMRKMLPAHWWSTNGYHNVWLGVTAENQTYYNHRWPILARTAARVRFVSYEPAIGPLDSLDEFPRMLNDDYRRHVPDWIICGGESGAHPRPMDLDWARAIRDECHDLGIPFFFKQVGGSDKHKGGNLLGGRTHQEFPI